MASREELNQLIGKAVADPTFREEFLKDSEAAAKKAGITLTAEQVEQFKKVDVTKVVQELEKVESKGCSYHLG